MQTLQEEFDSARIYLARWAMGIAEQSERDRNQRIWTARDVMELEDTDVGEFELLDSASTLSLGETRKPVNMKEWKTFFDPRTGRLAVTVDEVKERVFHGGLDPEDGVRKEAWLFLLGVHEWYSTADERKAQAASLRDEYIKLKGSWWERQIDQGGEGEQGEWWREQRGRIGMFFCCCSFAEIGLGGVANVVENSQKKMSTGRTVTSRYSPARIHPIRTRIRLSLQSAPTFTWSSSRTCSSRTTNTTKS